MWAITSLVLAELPSYQCKEINNATFINAKGKINPEVNSASGRSKLNVSLVTKKGTNNLESLRVNGTELQVTKVSGTYVYAVEFALNGMHTWVLFKNTDGKTYITLSKTYNFLGAPMTLYSLYACENVNNTF
jgi:endo-alpha-1,4-polygalactosaminidase (GH114 family)